MNNLTAPVYDQTIKFLATNVGRDRINRFVQFFSRFMSWYLTKIGGDKDLIKRFSNLQNALAQTRKIMQIGRQLEFIQGMQKSSTTIKDEILRMLTLIKNASLCFWLTYDMLQWAHTSGVSVLELPIFQKYVKRGNQFWLLALVSSLFGGFYKLRLNGIRLNQELKFVKVNGSKGKQPKDELAEKNLKSLRAEKTRILIAEAQDGLDMLIPASALEYVNVDPGIVSIAGMITSIIGGYTHWTSI